MSLFFAGKQQAWVAGRLFATRIANAMNLGHGTFNRNTGTINTGIRKMAFALTLAFTTVGLLAGCGGTASKSQPNAPTPPYNGTPINTYAITVTAKAGNITQSQQLTLSVQ
jgi:hypothetical protein